MMDNLPVGKPLKILCRGVAEIAGAPLPSLLEPGLILSTQDLEHISTVAVMSATATPHPEVISLVFSLSFTSYILPVSFFLSIP